MLLSVSQCYEENRGPCHIQELRPENKQPWAVTLLQNGSHGSFSAELILYDLRYSFLHPY
jgi:hypothetical protein